MKDNILEEILQFPTVINNKHESLLRSFHILNHVLDMVNRGDSKETIFEVVQLLKSKVK